MVPVIQAPLSVPLRAAFEESGPRWPFLPRTCMHSHTLRGLNPIPLGPPPPPFHWESAFPWFLYVLQRALMSCDIRLFLPPTHTQRWSVEARSHQTADVNYQSVFKRALFAEFTWQCGERERGRHLHRSQCCLDPNKQEVKHALVL